MPPQQRGAFLLTSLSPRMRESVRRLPGVLPAAHRRAAGRGGVVALLDRLTVQETRFFRHLPSIRNCCRYLHRAPAPAIDPGPGAWAARAARKPSPWPSCGDALERARLPRPWRDRHGHQHGRPGQGRAGRTTSGGSSARALRQRYCQPRGRRVPVPDLVRAGLFRATQCAGRLDHAPGPAWTLSSVRTC